jgi:hypothetical protein
MGESNGHPGIDTQMDLKPSARSLSRVIETPDRIPTRAEMAKLNAACSAWLVKKGVWQATSFDWLKWSPKGKKK